MEVNSLLKMNIFAIEDNTILPYTKVSFAFKQIISLQILT